MFGHADLDHEASQAEMFCVFLNAEFCTLLRIMELNTHDGYSGIKL